MIFVPGKVETNQERKPEKKPANFLWLASSLLSTLSRLTLFFIQVSAQHPKGLFLL